MLNLIAHDKLNTFCQFINSEQFKQINKAYSLIESPDITLRLCWSALQDEMFSIEPSSKKKTAKKVSSRVDQLMREISSDLAVLEQVFEDLYACLALEQYWGKFKKSFNFNRLAIDLGDGVTLFFLLTTHIAGQTIIRKYWDDFKACKAVWLPILFASITKEGLLQGTSAFYQLTGALEGQAILREHWSDFAPLLTAEGLFRPSTAEGAEQETSAFYWLTTTPEGRAILRDHWSDFAGYISREGLLQICTGEGVHQGMRPIDWLRSAADASDLVLSACELVLNPPSVSASTGGAGFFLPVATPSDYANVETPPDLEYHCTRPT